MGKRWKYVGDVDLLSHGGQFVRQIAGPIWHVIRFDNLADCCGQDAIGHPTYVADVREINLDSLSEVDRVNVGSSCDVGESDSDMWWALACASYGTVHSDIHHAKGNNAREILRELKILSDIWSTR
jgi:hypothetical protein